MNQVVGFLVIFGSIAAALLGGLWLFFSNVGRLHNMTPWQAAKNYVRKDLDAGPLTLWRVNLTYKAEMRKTGKMGPSGRVLPVRNITVAMPAEDYRFVKQFGIAEFAEQLAGYRHTYALKQGWYAAGDNPVPVSVWPNETLKRLRPVVSFEVAQDGTTRTITNTGDPDSSQGDGIRTEPLNGLAWLTFRGQEWTLKPQESPYRIGRAEGNTIRTVHDQISARHAVIRHSGTGWVLEPLETTNATKIGGRIITAPTLLNSGDFINIGQAEPIRFDEGTAVLGEDHTRTNRPGTTRSDTN